MLRVLLILIAVLIAPLQGFAGAYKAAGTPQVAQLPDLQATDLAVSTDRCCDNSKAIAVEISFCKLDCKALLADFIMRWQSSSSEFHVPGAEPPTSLGISVDLRPPIS